jgi:hypothetical protein
VALENPPIVPILISPDGTSIAIADQGPSASAATKIYKNGVLVTALPGWAVGWVDDNRLLVNTYTLGNGYPTSAPIPEVKELQTVSGSSIYAPALNSILSLTSGATLWRSPNETRGKGAVAGERVIFASGAVVRSERY